MQMRNCLSARWAFFICLIFIVYPPVSHAGFSVDVSTWIVQDGNAFQNYEQISDLIIQPSITAAYSKVWETNRLRLFYEGLLSHFQTYSNRQYQTHYGGLVFQQVVGDAGPMFTAGLQTGQRVNEDAWYAYYNYIHQIGYLNVRQQWGNRGLSLVGLWMQQRLYHEWQAFDHREIRLFFQQNFFLPSRTTVIAKIQLGNKKFLQSTVNEIVLQNKFEDQWSASTTRRKFPQQGGSSGAGGGSGDGNGNGGGGGNGQGRGQGIGKANALSLSVIDSTDDIAANTVRIEIPGKQVYQWLFSLRIAQSIHANTGLAVEGQLKRRTDGDGRLLLYQDSGYEDDDPLFDDPYGYDSQALSLELTQKLPWGLMFKSGWNGEERVYDYVAHDLEGNVVADSRSRADSRQLLWAMISKRFSFGIMKRAEMSVSFNLINNRSNELYSDYRDQVAMFGWSFGF